MFFLHVAGWTKRARFLPSGSVLRRTGAPRATGSRIADFRRDAGGNVAIITALSLPVLVGAMGLGGEAGFWYYRQQAMQSAADSAAVTAASASGASYGQEARGVAAKYGLVHGQGNVSVETQKGVTCPTAPAGVVYSECYKVTVTSLVPLFFSPVVGYQGNATVMEGDKAVPKTQLVATAVAARANTTRKYCVVALGQADVAVDVDINGAPKANLSGCGIMSNENMVCSGNARGVAAFADSPTGDTSPCGQVANNVPSPKIADPYAKLATNIPPNTCTSYGNTNLSVAPTGSEKTYCGDVTLTADITIPQQMVIVIRNGKLNLGGKTLKGSALTIIFTGTNGSSHHYVDGKGTLDITAPTSGIWKGIALYQDPSLTQNVNFTAAGSTQELIVSGLFYFPNAEVTLSGAVNKDVNPVPCLAMMVGSLRVNGGGFFADSSKCTNLLDLPSKQRGRLVG